MFGTLVIGLPSEHTGGTVCLQHGTEKEKFNTSASSIFGATYLAWFVSNVNYFIGLSLCSYRYADVIHEVSKIRLIQEFELISQKDSFSTKKASMDSYLQSCQRFKLPRVFCRWS